VVVEGLDNSVSCLDLGEAHLRHDRRVGSNEPAVQQISTDVAHHALNVRGGSSWCEVAGNHDVRSASSASYADAAAIRGRLFRSEGVDSGLRRSQLRGYVGVAVAVVAHGRRSGWPAAIARCSAI
jgi:hypothetical protein